jgi:hypothetical protein
MIDASCRLPLAFLVANGLTEASSGLPSLILQWRVGHRNGTIPFVETSTRTSMSGWIPARAWRTRTTSRPSRPWTRRNNLTDTAPAGRRQTRRNCHVDRVERNGLRQSHIGMLFEKTHGGNRSVSVSACSRFGTRFGTVSRLLLLQASLSELGTPYA